MRGRSPPVTPMLNILSATDLVDSVHKQFREGLHKGDKTDWIELDQFYSVPPGYFTIVTGIPAHGKSTWMDNLMVRLFASGWHFCIYSPENQPHSTHVLQIAEKLCGKPVSEMTVGDIEWATYVIDNHIRFLSLPEDALHMASLSEFLSAADEVQTDVFAGKKFGVIIDPWNELDHTRPQNMTETEFTCYELSAWRQWVRTRGAHGWICAHPAKPMKPKVGPYPVPTLYDINGSAHWYNKADFGITIWRDEDLPGTCEVHVKKVKFKHHGRNGIAKLDYDCKTGIYADSCYHDYATIKRRAAMDRTYQEQT